MTISRFLWPAAVVVLVAAAPAGADQVAASSCVLSPNNVIEGTPGFAVGQYCAPPNAITCPGGGFIQYAPYPTRFCQHVASGRIISGWESIQLNPVGQQWARADVEVENANDGCDFPYCGQPTETFVFARIGQGDWQYLRTITTQLGDRGRYAIVAGGHYDQVLLARFQGGPPRPDPRWWNFQAVYCDEFFPPICQVP